MRYIILDRDGVINQESERYITTPQEWVAIPGSLEAMARLQQQGYQLIVVSNQSGLGRHLFDIETLHAIHNKMIEQLAQFGCTITALFFCPHTPREECACRKPRTGLYENIAVRLDIILQETPCVGDRAIDIQAATQAGGQAMLVRTGHGARDWQAGQIAAQVPVFDDLAALSEYLCAN